METKRITEQAEKYYHKYRDYMDFYEKKSLAAKMNGGLRPEDAFALGKQLENFEDYTKFTEANGGQGDLGVLPQVG